MKTRNNDTERHRAYQAGVEAEREGSGPLDCPYPPNDKYALRLRCLWMAGYWDNARSLTP